MDIINDINFLCRDQHVKQLCWETAVTLRFVRNNHKLYFYGVLFVSVQEDLNICQGLLLLAISASIFGRIFYSDRCERVN